MKTAATFSELLQGFFTDRLMRQCGASPLTIANYRDTFRLLIAYAHRCLKKPPVELAIQDLDASFIAGFLDYLENERGNSRRSAMFVWRASIRFSITWPYRNPLPGR